MPLSTILNSRSRAALRRASRRVGLEAPLSALYERVDVTARRDAADARNIRLLLAFCLRADANCIDVGAHAGSVLEHMLRYAPDGRHIAYEPLPPFAARLRDRFPSVEVRNAAVSDHPGRATFTFVTDEPEQSGLKPRGWETRTTTQQIEVDVHQLDAALPDDYVPALIKVDVEGAERQVIEGAIETITRHKPIVIFEHGLGGSDHYGTRPQHLWDLLVGRASMRIFDLDGVGPYAQGEFDAVFDQPIWNFVAHP